MLSPSADLTGSLIDRLDDGVWVLDARDATVIEANPAARRQLGLPAANGTAPEGELDFLDLLVPRRTRGEWDSILRLVPDDGTHRLTVSLRHAEGRIVPAEVTLLRHRTARPDHEGLQDVVVAICRDVDDRVRLVEHLRSQRELLDSTIEALGEGVAVVDRTGRIESANEILARLVDLPIEHLLDRSILDPPWTFLGDARELVDPEDTPPAQALRSGAAAGPEVLALPGRGRNRSRDDLVWVRVACEPLRDGAGRTDGIVATFADVTAVRDAEARLRLLAGTDLLTGLRNRASITEVLERAVAGPGGPDDGAPTRRVGLLQVDLDNFRSINETFGTGVGDEVLRLVADRLRDLVDRHVEVGRIGVDEFLVVVSGEGPSLAFDTRLRRLAEEVQRRIEQPLGIEDLDLRLDASVGIARWPVDGDGADLLQAVGRALTSARKEGRRQIRFHERSTDEPARAGLALDRDLRLAAAQRGLEVHYQPIIDLRTGEVAAAEALVRWHHPEHGPIPPSVFIPTAEATGAITAVSDLVMTTVAEDLRDWNERRLLPAGARIAVNISATEFAQRGFVERISRALAEAGVSPSQLELEITETLLMTDLETTAQRLAALDDMGFLVALDDFGTGYSSLSYLHTLPLHTLKVDRCFVGDLRDGRSETITRSILSLARGLGIVAVGEGVETEEQRAFLLDAGCDLVQGFYFAPPLPRPAFERFLDDRRGASTTTGDEDDSGPGTVSGLLQRA